MEADHQDLPAGTPADVPAVAEHHQLGLATDLYELTMVDAALAEGLTDTAVFSLFARGLPPRRGYLLAAGIAEALEAVRHIRFDPEAIRYLSSLRLFREETLAYLEGYRFRGEIRAIPEGTPVFAQEPLVEVRAPYPEAQLLESLLMNQMHLATVAASKAARLVEAGRGRRMVDFGMRRAHGVEASLIIARASYLAGFAGTSNVLAGQRYGIPVVGTMAHSYVQAHRTELQAFRSFVQRFPQATLLVDTYDTVEGVRNVIRLAVELGSQFQVAGIRLDSGDLVALSAQARTMLDAAGLHRVQIFASGGLDEESIAQLVEARAPIHGFGVGTALSVAQGASSLDMAYKLVSYGGTPRMKLSTKKVSYPHSKQVFRVEQDGRVTHDLLACDGERVNARPLLRTVMQDGEPVARESLEAARTRAREELVRLPRAFRSLEPVPDFPVRLSGQLAFETERLASGLARLRFGS